MMISLITRTILLSLLALTLPLTGCGKSGSSGSATAKLKFSNATPVAMHQMNLTSPGADSFKMKLIAAYVAEDMDLVTQNNVGTTSMFYLNSECGDDISHCDTSLSVHGGLSEDGSPWTHAVTAPFDFSDVSSVNTALNAQGRSIEATTYKYIRLEFCKYSPDTPNIFWTYSADVAGEHSFAQPSCNVTRAIDPPLTLAPGETVTINLSYSMDGTLYSSGGGDNCAGSHCFTIPTFIPSVVR
jgi:hypothetical protein